MKIIKIVLLLLAVATIYSCKKDNNGDGAANNNLLSSKNPRTLSAALKVWHGTRMQGTPPAPSGGASAPQIQGPEKAYGYPGKFAYMLPEVMATTDIKGYYLAVNGASEYFKIDYTAPRNTGGRLNNRRRPSLLGRTNNNTDSAIVIELPPNLTVPDTFCITYCAYDSLGNIGTPVTTCVIVNSLGTSAGNAWINNNWRLVAETDDLGVWQYRTYNQYMLQDFTYFNYIHCVQGGGASYIQAYAMQYAPGTVIGTEVVVNFIGRDSVKYINDDIAFAQNGAFGYLYNQIWKWPNLSGNCNTPWNEDTEGGTLNGAWSLQSNRLVMIFDYDPGNGVTDYEAVDFTMEPISATEFNLVDPDDPQYKIKFRRL